NVLNPKTALFFLALLPQFVDPDRGGVWSQALALGLTFVALGLVTDSAYALAAGTVGGFLRRRRRTMRYGSGLVFVGLAAVAPLGKGNWRRGAAVGDVARDVDGAALADDRDLHLARIFELVLDLACDLVRQKDGAVVVHLTRLDDHADLAAGLQRIHLLHPRLLRCELLERRETLDVVLEALAPGAGA